MRSFNLSLLAGRASSWTCPKCTLSRRPLPQKSSYGTRTSGPASKRRPRPVVTYAAATGAAGASAFLFTEEIKHAYAATERSARVASTLAICVNDYRVTLNRKTECDKEQYDSLLKACHKRCAERTLDAMERNGSIFIKLGQVRGFPFQSLSCIQMALDQLPKPRADSLGFYSISARWGICCPWNGRRLSYLYKTNAQSRRTNL